MIESRLPHQNWTKHNDAQNFCSFTIIHSISTPSVQLMQKIHVTPAFALQKEDKDLSPGFFVKVKL